MHITGDSETNILALDDVTDGSGDLYRDFHFSLKVRKGTHFSQMAFE